MSEKDQAMQILRQASDKLQEIDRLKKKVERQQALLAEERERVADRAKAAAAEQNRQYFVSPSVTEEEEHKKIKEDRKKSKPQRVAYRLFSVGRYPLALLLSIAHIFLSYDYIVSLQSVLPYGGQSSRPYYAIFICFCAYMFTYQISMLPAFWKLRRAKKQYEAMDPNVR